MGSKNAIIYKHIVPIDFAPNKTATRLLIQPAILSVTNAANAVRILVIKYKMDKLIGDNAYISTKNKGKYFTVIPAPTAVKKITEGDDIWYIGTWHEATG